MWRLQGVPVLGDHRLWVVRWDRNVARAVGINQKETIFVNLGNGSTSQCCVKEGRWGMNLCAFMESILMHGSTLRNEK